MTTRATDADLLRERVATLQAALTSASGRAHELEQLAATLNSRLADASAPTKRKRRSNASAG